MAPAFSRASAIINSWQIENIPVHNNTEKRNLLDRAKTNIRWDYPFIFFYTLFGIVLLSWLRQRSRPVISASKKDIIKRISDAADTKPVFITNLLIRLMIAAGIFDVLENIGMFITIYSVENGIQPAINIPLLTSIAAWVKFILLAVLSLYILFMLVFKNRGLQSLSVYLQLRLTQAFRFRVIFIGIAGFAASIWILDQGQDLLDAYAAEHLEIQTADAEERAGLITNAGAIFVGSWSPVSLGDYCAGSNHVLPTAGCACHSSGLSVRSFLKAVHVVNYSRDALREVAGHVVTLADAEDLPGHGAAVSVRFPEEQ